MLIVGDFNFHIDCPTNSNTVSIMDMLQTFRFSQAVSVPTHRCGHTLDLVVHREEDSLLRSVSVCHSLSSDHLPVMDISKPESRPVLRTTRNLRAIDREHLREDTASLATVQPDITADHFNTQMHRLLDTHAPSTQRQVTCRRRRSPWYSSIASELRFMKQERRRAERSWLSTGLTIHKETMNSVKHKISHLVSSAKLRNCIK